MDTILLGRVTYPDHGQRRPNWTEEQSPGSEQDEPHTKGGPLQDTGCRALG